MIVSLLNLQARVEQFSWCVCFSALTEKVKKKIDFLKYFTREKGKLENGSRKDSFLNLFGIDGAKVRPACAAVSLNS